MNKLDTKQQEIAHFCQENSNEDNKKKFSRYFKGGFDGYGIDNEIFINKANTWINEWKNEMTLVDYLDLGDKLIAEGKYEEKSFAFQFILSKKEEFDLQTFNRIGNWLENGINNWANTDVLCMSVLSLFFYENITKPDDFNDWTQSQSLWKRRAVPVTFVELIKKNYDPIPLLKVIEPIMNDKEEDVQKGIGTLLREIWKKHQALAEEFLTKWKNTCGRKIIQYATEKMDKESKLKFKRDNKK